MKFVLASELQRIEPRFNALLGPNTSEIPKNYAVSPGDGTYVITSQEPHLIQVFTFGMTPFNAAEPMNLINARVEGDKNGADNPYYNGSKAIFLQQAKAAKIGNRHIEKTWDLTNMIGKMDKVGELCEKLQCW